MIEDNEIYFEPGMSRRPSEPNYFWTYVVIALSVLVIIFATFAEVPVLKHFGL